MQVLVGINKACFLLHKLVHIFAKCHLYMIASLAISVVKSAICEGARVTEKPYHLC